jgi:hypothetical protein
MYGYFIRIWNTEGGGQSILNVETINERNLGRNYSLEINRKWKRDG